MTRFLRRFIPSRCETCGKWSRGDSCRPCVEKLKMAMLERFWSQLASEVTAVVGPTRNLNELIEEFKAQVGATKPRGDAN